MDEKFYRAFEDRFRCSRSVIKARCANYAPFLLDLSKATGTSLSLDIGCGRGEWLEYASEQGFSASGVDLDSSMVQSCRELGLEAVIGDALQHLEQQPDASHALITAFHVAEHLPFDYLHAMVHQALRVLAPGGLLIMETPNAENLAVGSAGFYLDPTHQRPIPQLLLSFLAEYAGFERFKIMGLQQPESMDDGAGGVGLYHVVHGVSPDYALVAQKSAAPEQQGLLNAAFAHPRGISLDSLLVRFDTRLERALVQAQQAQAAAQQAQAAAQQAQAAAQQAQAASADHLAQLQAIHASSTWRYVSAIRRVLARLRPSVFIPMGLRQLRWLTSVPRRAMTHLARHGLAWVRARPGLQQRIVAAAHRVGLYAWLRRSYLRWVHDRGHSPEPPFGLHTGSELSPWAQHMARRLEAARTGLAGHSPNRGG